MLLWLVHSVNYAIHWFLDSLMRKNGVLGHRSAWAWRSPWWPRPALQVIHVHDLQKRIFIKTQINHGYSVRKIGLYYKIAVQGVWGGQWCLASHCQVQTFHCNAFWGKSRASVAESEKSIAGLTLTSSYWRNHTWPWWGGLWKPWWPLTWTMVT